MKEELLLRLDALAAELGVAVDHILEVYIRQAVAYGWSGLVLNGGGVLLFISIIIGIVVGYYKFYHWLDDGEEEGRLVVGVICLLAIVFLFLITVLTLCELRTACLHIYNPEYYALKTLLGHLG